MHKGDPGIKATEEFFLCVARVCVCVRGYVYIRSQLGKKNSGIDYDIILLIGKTKMFWE